MLLFILTYIMVVIRDDYWPAIWMDEFNDKQYNHIESTIDNNIKPIDK